MLASDQQAHHLALGDGQAERLANYIGAVGADRVIAGTDCGFSTLAWCGVVDPGVVWAKFDTMVAGAALASRRAG